MALNDLECKHAQPRIAPYKLVDGEGLYLDVRPTGQKIWRQRYKIHGKEKLLTFGSYPQLTLVKAREKKDIAKAEIKSGIDPAVTKRTSKHRAKYEANQTFELVAREWHETYKHRWSKRHKETMLNRLEQNVFPILGKLPISSITAPDLFDCIKKVEERKHGIIAQRVLQITKQVFRHAKNTGRVKENITSDLIGVIDPVQKGHFASIKVGELPEFIKRLQSNDIRVYRQTMIAMWLMLLTFVRTSELIEAQWSEFDLDKAEWHIPGERMKMRRPHFVPLSKQSIVLLRELEKLTKRDGSEHSYIFPSITRRDRPMSNTTLLMALRRLNYYRKMTGHGFRSLAMSSIKEKLDYKHDIVDRQLAHAPKNEVDKAYDRAEYLEQRIQMMQDWADYIDECKTSS